MATRMFSAGPSSPQCIVRRRPAPAGERERRREHVVVDAALGVVAADADQLVAVLRCGELDELDGGRAVVALVDVEDHAAADVEVGVGVGEPGADARPHRVEAHAVGQQEAGREEHLAVADARPRTRPRAPRR